MYFEVSAEYRILFVITVSVEPAAWYVTSAQLAVVSIASQHPELSVTTGAAPFAGIGDKSATLVG
jgi:hypothetical protein